MLKNGFYELLHRRGVTLKGLAAELRTTHAHLSQVFNGKRGKHTRKHIARLLTVEEIAVLGWNEPAGMSAPPETEVMFLLEQCST